MRNLPLLLDSILYANEFVRATNQILGARPFKHLHHTTRLLIAVVRSSEKGSNNIDHRSTVCPTSLNYDYCNYHFNW